MTKYSDLKLVIFRVPSRKRKKKTRLYSKSLLAIFCFERRINFTDCNNIFVYLIIMLLTNM